MVSESQGVSYAEVRSNLARRDLLPQTVDTKRHKIIHLVIGFGDT